MKRRVEATINDLPLEVLVIILSMLGKIYNGAASFAQAMTVSKSFLKASYEVEGSAFANFQFPNIKIEEDQLPRYQQRKGLIYDCARAGNAGAQYVLAKVILPTCTQMIRVGVPKQKLIRFKNFNLNKTKGGKKYLEKAIPASFLYHFIHKEPASSASSPPVLTHWNLVRIFISKPGSMDVYFFKKHLIHYVEYFWGKANYDSEAYLFLHFIQTLSALIVPRYGSVIVRHQGYFYVKANRESWIYPPMQLQGGWGAWGGDQSVVDWKYVPFVAEEVREQSVRAFNLLLQQLE